MAYWKDDLEKTTTKDPHHRQGPDLLSKWVRLSGFLVWLFIAITIVFIDGAKPQLYTILDMHYGKIARDSWNGQFLMVALYIAIGTFLFSLFSLILNAQRLKRKTDHIKVSLVLGLIASGVLATALFAHYINTLA